MLDEPTNHLDIDSKEVLENALIDFEGTLLFVSHDRYFINRLANKIIEIEPDGATLYLGDYDYYLHKKEELYEQNLVKEAEEAANNPTEDTADTNQSTNKWADRKESKREIRRLEREIADTEMNITRLEEELEELTQKMDELSSSGKIFTPDDSKNLTDYSKRFNEVNEELEAVMLKWESAHEELSEYEE